MTPCKHGTVGKPCDKCRIEWLEQQLQTLIEAQRTETITTAAYEAQELKRRRDVFAAAALTGVLACFKDYSGYEGFDGRIKYAWRCADAMIARENWT